MTYCDLHTHSYYSDGTFSPAELIAAAEKRNLGAVALCDHNTVAGLPEFLEAARGSRVEAVPGVEFSTDYGDRELHILGLFIRPEDYAAVTELLEDGKRRKEQSNIDLVDALNRAGYRLDYGQIRGKTPGGQVNRAHIAAALTEAGYTESVKDAFRTLLAPSRGYYTPPKRPDALETVAFIAELGSVPVLAHPFLNLKQEGALREFLSRAKPRGLAGMETMYPLFDEEQTRLAGAIAEEFGLLPSGGSDFHGGNKPDIALGTGKGNLAVPISCLEKLKSRITSKR